MYNTTNPYRIHFILLFIHSSCFVVVEKLYPDIIGCLNIVIFIIEIQTTPRQGQNFVELLRAGLKLLIKTIKEN